MKVGDHVRIGKDDSLVLSRDHPISKYRGVIEKRHLDYPDRPVWYVRWNYPTMYNPPDPCLCPHYESTLALLAAPDSLEGRVQSYLDKEFA